MFNQKKCCITSPTRQLDWAQTGKEKKMAEERYIIIELTIKE